jgi:hypothetical protein
MSDEENIPEVAKLSLRGLKSAYEGVIRTGPGNPGLAQPEYHVYASLRNNPGQAGSS